MDYLEKISKLYDVPYLIKKYDTTYEVLSRLDKNGILICYERDSRNRKWYDKKLIDSISKEKFLELSSNKKKMPKIIGDLEILEEIPVEGKKKRRMFKVKCLVCGDIRTSNMQWIQKHNEHKETTCGKSNRVYDKKFNRTYNEIIRRCTDKNRPTSKYYVLKNITCDFTYREFYNHMFEEYKKHIELHGAKNTTIDRIDSSKSYTLDNIRWATLSVQSNNKNHKENYREFREKKYGFPMSKIVEIQKEILDKKITLKNKAKELKMSDQTLRKLIRQYGV